MAVSNNVLKNLKYSRKRFEEFGILKRETAFSSTDVVNYSSQKKRRGGTKEYDQNKIDHAVESVPLYNRGTTDRLLSATGIFITTLQDAKNNRTITPHRSFVKPSRVHNSEMEIMKFEISIPHSIAARDNQSFRVTLKTFWIQ